ncbi:MAG: heavy metal transporter [Gammaproteobacteria bacterium]
MMFRIDNLAAAGVSDTVTATIKRLDGLAWVGVDTAAGQVRVESMAAGDAVADALRQAGLVVEAVAARSGCCGGCGG